VKGDGHGDYRTPVLAPASIGEAMTLTADAFELAERYRTPVIILADGILGQAMEPVRPDFPTLAPQTAEWRIEGAEGREPRSIRSLHLRAEDLEAHNLDLQATYAQITETEQRWAGEQLDDAEVVLVAYGTAARVARTAVERAREQGLRAGLFRPITLWPFPADGLREVAGRARAVLVVEMSAGQMVEDVRLTLEGSVPVLLHARMGGAIPTPDEVVAAARHAWSSAEPGGPRGLARTTAGGDR
jgi:2-oxoglutarate ferredoxin oxidoreductase subunit alpha